MQKEKTDHILHWLAGAQVIKDCATRCRGLLRSTQLMGEIFKTLNICTLKNDYA